PDEPRTVSHRQADLRPCVQMLLLPLIPGSSSLFQDCQMFFVRHCLSPAAPRELPRHISRELVGTQELSAITAIHHVAAPPCGPNGKCRIAASRVVQGPLLLSRKCLEINTMR